MNPKIRILPFQPEHQTGITDMMENIALEFTEAIFTEKSKKIIDVFGNVVDMMIEVNTMEDAVKMAQRLSEKGDTVLLSPACASFDLFENYEDRGNQFKQAVKNL